MEEMNGFTQIGVAAIGSLIVASAAMAQGAAPPTPEQKAQAAVLTRQGLFKLQGFVFWGHASWRTLRCQGR
jgi:hypothetical protein